MNVTPDTDLSPLLCVPVEAGHLSGIGLVFERLDHNGDSVVGRIVRYRSRPGGDWKVGFADIDWPYDGLTIEPLTEE